MIQPFIRIERLYLKETQCLCLAQIPSRGRDASFCLVKLGHSQEDLMTSCNVMQRKLEFSYQKHKLMFSILL